jgi:hypothetical protein
MDPFPGNISQIFEAIFLDKKPLMPTHFPSDLKELMHRGWSKKPKERPPIEEFKYALMTMLIIGEKIECTQATSNNNSPETVLLNEREAQVGNQEKYNEMLKPRTQESKLALKNMLTEEATASFHSQTLPGTKEQEKAELTSCNDSKLGLSPSNTATQLGIPQEQVITSKETPECKQNYFNASEGMDKMEKQNVSKVCREEKISKSFLNHFSS